MLLKKIYNKEMSTNVLREWLGFFGVFTWMFFCMYNFDGFLAGGEDGHGFVVPFLLSVAVVMLVLALKYKDTIRPLSRISFFTTPPAIILTAVMPLFPPPVFAALYILSGALMAPVILRRIYGIVTTARPDRMFRAYFSTISAGIFLHGIWLVLSLPVVLRFLIPAVLAVPGWIGVRRTVPEWKSNPQEWKNKPTESSRKRKITLYILPVTAILLLLFAASVGNALIHTHFAGGGPEDNLLNWLGSILLPPLGFMIYAWFSDKKRDMSGFALGALLTMLGLMSAFVSGDSIMSYPILLSNGLGSHFVEFIFLSFSLHFIAFGRKPVLMACLGCVVNIMLSAIFWVGSLWLPSFLTVNELSIPILIFTAVCFILIFTLIFFLTGRQRERNLALSVSSLFRTDVSEPDRHNAETTTAGAFSNQTVTTSSDHHKTETTAAPSPEKLVEALTQAGFTDTERKIAMQLIEGNTQSEIARYLHLPAGEVRGYLRQIRDKISGVPPQGKAAVLEKVADDYALTKREVQVLESLSEGKTNAEIAAGLFISEETVKFHVRNLMKKLPVDGRYQILSWLNEYHIK